MQAKEIRTTDEDLAQSMRDAIYNCAQRISKNGVIEYGVFGSNSSTEVTALSQLVTTYAFFNTMQKLTNDQNAKPIA